MQIAQSVAPVCVFLDGSFVQSAPNPFVVSGLFSIDAIGDMESARRQRTLTRCVPNWWKRYSHILTYTNCPPHLAEWWDKRCSQNDLESPLDA